MPQQLSHLVQIERSIPARHSTIGAPLKSVIDRDMDRDVEEMMKMMSNQYPI
jgi:DNA mismatch repair protein MutH